MALPFGGCVEAALELEGRRFFVVRRSGRDGTVVALGRVVATRAAAAALSSEDITRALARHARGDWGEVCDEDREANEVALREGARLLSVYDSSTKVRFWVITEADRSATTVLLPDDY